MSIIRSERTAAGLLLGAAALGLFFANTAIGPILSDIQHSYAGPEWARMSIGHWINDGLLAIFFFIVAVELKHELVVGELNSVKKAIRPAIAAIGGILVPASIYLFITKGTEFAQGWPIPTATDIAFALGILAIFGKNLPNKLRIFLLALAILDDLAAILIIAIFFTNEPNLMDLLLATVVIALFGVLSKYIKGDNGGPIIALMVLLALLTWWLIFDSGVHPTLAGVALGLVTSRKPAHQAAHVLQPWSNAFILPLFAFSSALVVIPYVPISQLSPAFWGILIALPLGKLIGISLFGWIASLFKSKKDKAPLPLSQLIAVAALGGIGFTVSLLMNELAFVNNSEVRPEGTLAVLLASVISIIISGALIANLSKKYRKIYPHSSKKLKAN